MGSGGLRGPRQDTEGIGSHASFDRQFGTPVTFGVRWRHRGSPIQPAPIKTRKNWATRLPSCTAKGAHHGFGQRALASLGHCADRRRARRETGVYLSRRHAGETRRPLAESLGSDLVLPCDVSDPASIDGASTRLRGMGGLDFVVHAIAFPTNRAFGPVHRYLAGQLRANAGYLVLLVYLCLQARRPLMSSGGSLLTLTYYGAEKVVPHYNVMGVAKPPWKQACDTWRPTLAEGTSASTRSPRGRSRPWPRPESATSGISEVERIQRAAET